MAKPDVPPRCPHCGNTDPQWIANNGADPRSVAYTLLCMKPCQPGESSFEDADEWEQAEAAKGTLVCGMQWEPNACRGFDCTAGLMPGEVCDTCGKVCAPNEVT
jgi:hypothetical protein